MAGSATVVGSIVYDAVINIDSLKKSVAEVEKVVGKSYSDQKKSANRSSKELSEDASKNAQERIKIIKNEAEQAAKNISSYTPTIQRQFLSVERANNAVVSATVRAQNAIQNYGMESIQAVKASNALSIAIQNQAQQQTKLQSMIDGSANKTGSFSGAMSKAGAVAGATAAVLLTVLNKAIQVVTNSIDAAVKRIDTLNNAPKVLQNLGFSAEESASATQRLDKSIRGLPTSLDKATSSLLAIASASGKGLDYATDLTIAFNNMALAGGKGPAEAERALTQFTQALGRGKFEMDDFNTLAEVMPAQLNQVAKSLLGAGANTRTLGMALGQGEISIDSFNNEVIRLNKEGGSNFASFEAQARDASSGIETSFTNMQTSITRGVASIVTAIGSSTISGFATGAGKSIENILNSIALGFKFVSDAVSVLLEWLKPLLDYLKENRTAMEVLKTTLLVIAALLVGAILAAITLVTVAVTALTFVIDTLVKAFDNVMETGIAAWNGIVSTWNGAAEWFNNIFNGIYQSVTTTFSNVGNFFTNLWNDIVRIFGGIGASVGNSISSAFKNVMNGVISYVEGTINNISKIINGISKSIDDVLPGDQSKLRVPEVALPRFSNGGFTGRGGKYDPAGIVHAGEYVIPKNMVNQTTGIPKPEAVGAKTNEPENTFNITIHASANMIRSEQDKREFAKMIFNAFNQDRRAKSLPEVGAI